MRKFLLQNSSIKFIFFDDSTGSNALFTLEQGPHIDIVKIVKSELLENESKIERLFSYSREGYNKIEPISIKLKNTTAVISIIELTGGKEILRISNRSSTLH